MKKIFIALALVLALNVNTFAMDMVTTGGLMAVGGIACTAVGLGIDNEALMTAGLIGMVGGGIIYTIGFFIDDYKKSSAEQEKPNKLAEHLQLGISPNAKAGYAGVRFKF